MKRIIFGNRQVEYPDSYEYLGIRNEWKEEPGKYIKCIELGHETTETHLSDRGSCNVVVCDKCEICWEYDSSD